MVMKGQHRENIAAKICVWWFVRKDVL